MGTISKKSPLRSSQRSTLFQGDLLAKEEALSVPSRKIVPRLPFGRRCCNSSRHYVRGGWWWKMFLGFSRKWLRSGPLSFNSWVTDAQGNVLVADTGCPNCAPVPLSSHEWKSLGWRFGITYTLTTSEGKWGPTDIQAGNKAASSFARVPTVCEMEFLQGFPRGSLRAWAQEMLLRFRSRDSLRKESLPSKP